MMSDFWSVVFLCMTMFLVVVLVPTVLRATRFGKVRRYLNTTVFGLIVTLLLVWAVDRFVVGLFCLPWECIRSDVDIEALLLDDADLPEGWVMSRTFHYAYDPRASSAYVSRSFRLDLDTRSMDFYQEVYQYKSERGASFQYNDLKHDLPRHYSLFDEPVSLAVDFSDNHASAYIVECLHGSNSICYYIAQYGEYVVTLEMPFSNGLVPQQDIIALVQLIDQKLARQVQFR